MSTHPSQRGRLMAALSAAGHLVANGPVAAASINIRPSSDFPPGVVGVDMLLHENAEAVAKYRDTFGGTLTHREGITGDRASRYTETKLLGSLDGVPFMVWTRTDKAPVPPGAAVSAAWLGALLAPSHTSAPDVPEDSPAALLALRVRNSQPDVVATEVTAADRVGITVRPQSVECWNWWTARLSVDLKSTSHRDGFSVARGSHRGVTVHLTGLGVPALLGEALQAEQEARS